MKNISTIILAAGKGERMKSSLPKVLHPVCARPMLSYVLDLAESLKCKPLVTVVGYKHEEVTKCVDGRAKTVIQKRLAGTADAVKVALPLLKGFTGTVLILYGDIPLLTSETIKKLLKKHNDSDAQATLLTAKTDNPFGYG